MDVETFIKSDMCVDLDVYTQSCSELVPGHHHPEPHWRTINKTWGPQDACLYNTGNGLVYGAMLNIWTAQCPAQLIR